MGRRKRIQRYSNYNKNVPGEYVIKVSYKEYTPIEYKVNVFGLEGLTLGKDAIEKKVMPPPATPNHT